MVRSARATTHRYVRLAAVIAACTRHAHGFAGQVSGPSRLTGPRPRCRFQRGLTVMGAVTAPLSLPRSAASEKTARFLERVADEQGVYYDQEKLTVFETPYGGGLGIEATSDLAAGEEIMEIPWSACLGVDMALSDPSVGEVLAKFSEAAGPGSELVVLAGALGAAKLRADRRRYTIRQLELWFRCRRAKVKGQPRWLGY